MPCMDYYDTHPESYFKDVSEPSLKKQIAFAESALCQTLTALERVLDFYNQETGSNLLMWDQIDFKEAGISKYELAQWWNNHQKLDEQHREEERLNKVKEEALAKLSDEEKKALGLT